MKTDKIFLHKSSKFNHKEHKGICCMCLEYSNFRHVMYNGINTLMCVRCLTGKPYDQRYKDNWRLYMTIIKLSNKLKVIRQYYRIKKWFTGDHIYKPLGKGRKNEKKD